ncbi:hypothetical protein LLH06_16715 [Mucilaginibacter daejeonensis]|uniref:hypothetical protein n=1 Tax=Mucilaginibacter daejeonensis TaxID=398049 RepID=UPI001D17852D|nr:hypothetical protein [Mucilaginibacter daejeonensis]UEG52599.1 hypothetical protein LLH06_16715 [Mucilaginibacter daejeonensis]
MVETTTLNLSNACVEALQTDNHDRLDLLDEELKNHQGVVRLLSAYHDGAHTWYEYQSSDVDTDGNGSFEVNYTVERYSGCKDVNLDEEHHMVISISVNLVTAEATITSEEKRQPEPDAY